MQWIAIVAPRTKRFSIAKKEKSYAMQWDRTSIGTANNKRIKLHLHFEQQQTGVYMTTTLTVEVVYVQKWVLAWWQNTTADRIVLSGELVVRVLHATQVENLGYAYPNPFQINYSSGITHFTDVASARDPLFTMDRARYVVTAVFGTKTTSATLEWGNG
jgi:hypothetical protein